MKNVSNNFKENIKKYGRQIDCKIEVGTLTIGKEQINSVVPSFNTSLFKSIMYGFEIDSNVIIPKGNKINIKIGIKFGLGNYEYIDFKDFEVFSCERQEDTESYKIIAYDKILDSMVDFDLEISEKLTVREYLVKVFQRLGWPTNGIPDTFINSTKLVEPIIHYGIQYTFRDVLDELATITGSFILVENEIPKIKYITETSQIINEEYLSESDVTLKDKYFINSLVFSRAEESDNIYRKNDESIEQYGLHEFRIADNQILSTNDRVDFIDELFNYLETINFYIFDVKSTGIMWLEAADIFTFNIRGNSYKTILLNDEITIEQDIEEHLYTDEPGETETDYKCADETDRRINQTYIMVDKQNQKIIQLANQSSEYQKKLTQVEQDVDSIKQKVSSVEEFSREITGINEIHLTNTAEGKNLILSFQIKGDSNKFKYLASSNELAPSETLVPYGDHFTLVCDNQSRNNPSENKIEYDVLLDEPLRNIDEVYDELNIINGKIIVTRRIGVDENLSLYVLDNEIIQELGELVLDTFKGDTYIYILEYKALRYYCKYITDNEYIEMFATQNDLQNAVADLDSSITQTAEDISLEVSKKVGNDEIISRINQSAEEIKIEADKISLSGKELNLADNMAIKSNNFNVDKNGNMSCNNAKINGGKIILDGGTQENPNFLIESDKNNLRTWVSNDSLSIGTGSTYISFYVNEGSNECGFSILGESSSISYITNGTAYVGNGFFGMRDVEIGFTVPGNNTYTTIINGDFVRTPKISTSELTVTGSKNRAVKIDNNSYVLLNAYETAMPYFGDIGSNKTDKNGYCKIEIENIFKKTIEIENYKVFIQECGNGKLYVKKQNDYFEVFGTPNLEFDWEIKAIQKGYKNTRLAHWKNEIIKEVNNG